MSSNRFGPYRDALNALSTRTRTPLPSLLVSFAVLHELTAVVPLVGIFFGARALGVGERVVSAVYTREPGPGDSGWAREKCQSLVEDGEKWAQRVGRRYGIFGFEKADRHINETTSERYDTGRIAGDVANAVVAYGATKALLPVRVGLSLYLSPAFSRRVVEPCRKTVLRAFRR